MKHFDTIKQLGIQLVVSVFVLGTIIVANQTLATWNPAPGAFGPSGNVEVIHVGEAKQFKEGRIQIGDAVSPSGAVFDVLGRFTADSIRASSLNGGGTGRILAAQQTFVHNEVGGGSSQVYNITDVISGDFNILGNLTLAIDDWGSDGIQAGDLLFANHLTADSGKAIWRSPSALTTSGTPPSSNIRVITETHNVGASGSAVWVECPPSFPVLVGGGVRCPAGLTIKTQRALENFTAYPTRYYGECNGVTGTFENYAICIAN